MFAKNMIVRFATKAAVETLRVTIEANEIRSAGDMGGVLAGPYPELTLADYLEYMAKQLPARK